MRSYPIRAVQMDLARQMESMEYIKGFLDSASQNGYNAVVFYIEWRIRTKTVDIGAEKGYSAGQLRELIDFAKDRGIMIIPGLATLGHSDILLAEPEYKHLAELREGIKGRFESTELKDLCPALPETRDLIRGYIHDVAEIFQETPYLHIGFDEVHDLGFCTKCRPAAETFAGEEKILLDHLFFVYNEVKSCGKQVMMWDDMFENYPDILPQIPRDVIMVCWQYQRMAGSYVGHFSNMSFRNPLERYDELGFAYMIATYNAAVSNIETLTLFAENHHPLGGLVTSWGGPSLDWSLPVFGAAGRFWSGNASSMKQALRDFGTSFFGITEPDFFEALEAYSDFGVEVPCETNMFSFYGPDSSVMTMLPMILSVFRRFLGQVCNDKGRALLETMILKCERGLLLTQISRFCWNCFHGEQQESFDDFADRIAQVKERNSAFLPKAPDMANFLDRLNGNLRKFESDFTQKGFLKVLFAQADYYGAPFTRILLNGKEIAFSVFKCIPDPFYEFYIFIPKDTEIREIRFEQHGYGDQGIAYVSGMTGKGEFIPDAVTEVSGNVTDPDHLLVSDVRCARLGDTNIQDIFHDRKRAEVLSSVTICMRKKQKGE